MIRLTVDAPGWREVYEGTGAQEVGEQLVAKHGPTAAQVPWEDRMDDGWVFPRFVITEELQEWAASAAGVTPDRIRIEDI